MLLSHLPIDILRPICAKIYAADVVHLIMTGSKQMGQNVSHVATDVEDLAPHFSKFPFSLYQLPNLQSLTIRSLKPTQESPLIIGIAPIFPHVDQKSLTTLKFSFGQSFHVLRDKTLSNFAPNLENLSCSNAVVDFDRLYLENVPTNLKKLVLKNSSLVDSPTFGVTIGELIMILSDRLENLEIDCIKILENDHKDAPTKLPATLKTLTLSWAPPCIFQELPQGLETLKISLDAQNEVDLTMSQLPKSLKYLKIFGYFDLQFDCPMPDLITIRARVSFPTPEAVNFLSPKLTNLPYTSTPLGHGNFPNLQEIEFSGTDAKLNNLNIPPTARTVDLHGKTWKTSHLLQLPSTLVSLSAPIKTADAFAALPRGLKELVVFGAQKGKQIPQSYWLQLPPSLTFFECTLEMLADIKCLSALPKTLEGLNIRITGSLLPDSQRGSHAAICQDPSLPAHFPPNLKAVTLRIHDMSNCAILGWLENLSHLTSLETLNVYSSDESKNAILIHESIPKLPKTLTSLQIPLDNRAQIDPSALSHFPPALTALALYLTRSLGEQKTIYTNEHFANLPNSLYRLQISSMYPSGVSENLTSDLIELLPQKLVFLTLADQVRMKTEIAASFKKKKRWVSVAMPSEK